MRRRLSSPRTTSSRIATLLAAATMTAALLALMAVPAAAHEERNVEHYTFVVGFGEEPAYAGSSNSVQVMVSDEAGKPVRDVGDTLGVMVIVAGQEKKLALEPAFGDDWGTPGDYRAYFVPSAPGGYTFHLHGTVHGHKVDQKFVSGPKTFGDVQDPAKASFPALKGATAAQLATRLDRELPRLAASTQRALVASQAAERQARDVAAQARLLALGGVALGLIGVVLAGIALARRPGRHAPASRDGYRVPQRTLS